MKLCSVLCIASLGMTALAGCGSSDDEGGSGGPVAATPLKGSIAGAEFVGKIAVASPAFDDDTKRSIAIYDVDADCRGRGGDREILTTIEWRTGLTKDLKLALGGGDSQTVTFVTGPGENVISSTGRIEVIDAPSEVNARGKLRLRASAEENQVEGEIDVLVCER